MDVYYISRVKLIQIANSSTGFVFENISGKYCINFEQT